jgi:hypothetical protein
MLVKIPKCVARRVAQSTRTTSHLRPDKGQPDVADHSHPRTQARGRAARMSFKVIFDVGFYHRRELFNCKRDHIQETCMDCILDLKPQKGISRPTLKAMRGRIALRKHCVRNRQERTLCYSPRKSAQDYSRAQTIATEVVRLPPMLKVRNFFALSICRAPAWSVSC